MKIQGPHVPNGLKPARSQNRPEESNSASSPKGKDHVAVSGGAQRLAAARAPETPDAGRIAVLREAIEKGSFEVDPRRIAESMVKEER